VGKHIYINDGFKNILFLISAYIFVIVGLHSTLCASLSATVCCRKPYFAYISAAITADESCIRLSGRRLIMSGV